MPIIDRDRFPGELVWELNARFGRPQVTVEQQGHTLILKPGTRGVIKLTRAGDGFEVAFEPYQWRLRRAGVTEEACAAASASQARQVFQAALDSMAARHLKIAQARVEQVQMISGQLGLTYATQETPAVAA
jgi:hypothetical protein